MESLNDDWIFFVGLLRIQTLVMCINVVIYHKFMIEKKKNNITKTN